jgi:dephospho-CoA kinase
MIVILLSGKAGSGKDTFWNITNNHFSPRVKCFRLAFGDAVKKLAMEHAGWNGIKDAPGRKLLQSLGEVGREYNEDSWVNKIIPALKRHAANGTHLVCITDCRYPNEIERIKEIEKELGTVITVRIERPTREDLGANSRHLSETALDSYRFTHTLFNNGTEKEFEEQVHRFLTFLSGKSNNNQKTESECDHF